MALTGDQLFARMQRKLPELRNAGSGEKARAISHLEDCQEQLIAEINDLDEDFFTRSSTAPTAANQKRYSLPVNLDSIRNVEIITDEGSDTSYPLTEIHYIPHKDWWEQLTDDLNSLAVSASGRPIAYMFIGNFLELRPIPDAVYTMRLWYRHDANAIALSESGETVVPPALYEALVLMACIAERIYRHQRYDRDLQPQLDRALVKGLDRVADRHDAGPKFINYQHDHYYDF